MTLCVERVINAPFWNFYIYTPDTVVEETHLFELVGWFFLSDILDQLENIIKHGERK